MFCQKCGNKITDDAAFCHKCGAEVQSNKSVKESKADTFDSDELAELTIFNKRINFPGATKAKFDVLVDGNKIGIITGNETLTYKITPGKHCVQVPAGSSNYRSVNCCIWIDIPMNSTPITLIRQWNSEKEVFQFVCNQNHLVVPAPLGSAPEIGGNPYCPNCKSQNLFPISESEVNVSGGGYGFGSGCCGWLLLGPIGLLCGFCGRRVRSQSQNRQFWLCKSCGHKFRDAEDEYREKQAALGGMFGVFFMSLIASGVFDYLDINFLWLPPRIYQIAGLLGMAGVIASLIYLYIENQKR